MRCLVIPFALLLLPFVSQPAAALHIAEIEGAGWQAQDLRMQLSLAEGDSSGRIQLAALALPAHLGSLKNLQLDCRKLIFEARRIACVDAPLSAEWDLLDKPVAQASFEYLPASGRINLQLSGLAALGGQLALTLTLQADGWQAQGKLQALTAARVAPLLKAAGLNITADIGRVDGKLQMQGDAMGQTAEFELRLSGLTAYDEAGDLASEGLGLLLQGKAHSDEQVWQADLRFVTQNGQAYVNPVFVDTGKYPATLQARVNYDVAAQRVAINALHLQQPGVATVQGSLLLHRHAETALQKLDIELLEVDMAGAYATYMQPFLLGTGLDELQVAGSISGHINMAKAVPQRVALKLQAVTAHDTKERFSVDELSGVINWDAPADQAKPSQLNWRSGSVYKLPLEAGDLKLQASDTSLTLLEPLRLALLGGAVRVNKFAATGLGTPALALQFDGGLEPLRLTDLTRALGWPQFAGSLSGRLPDLSYKDGDLTVGGTLAAEVFDGKVAVEGLRIADPFGRLPRLRADISMRNLDLAAATSAFQFGAIEGRLDADVKGLRLLNWQPVAVDARFYTPPGDRSRHRISQRAIENISSLGGAGAGAVLSRGFMRFFENFAYARLGISCRLANGVCLMGGIEAAPDKGGYYLVKGKLLPRIDVIGYADEVSWPALVEQLRSISAGEGPEVR